MRKLSLLKLAAALTIGSGYLFVCGTAGVVSDSSIVFQTDEESEQTEETGADGLGTLDFFIPDQTGSGGVDLKLLNLSPVPLANKPVQSTYQGIRPLVTVSEPTDEETEEFTTEEVITPDEETEEAVQTTAAATTAATTRATTTTPATTATTASTTTKATTTTVSTTTSMNGIPVEDEPEIPSDQSDELEPTIESESNQESDFEQDTAEVSGEILTVQANGGIVSGTALDIVSRITQSEIGHTFAPEAIKAQAVAAYSYVKFCNDYGFNPAVALADTVTDSVMVLVKSVIGEAIYYNGSVIQAVYSASSAGYSASAKSVWGTNYPYLSSRFCELDEQYDPNYGLTANYSSDDIKNKVYSTTGIVLSGDPGTWFRIEDYIEGKYVGQMSIGGYHSYTDSSGSSIKLTGRVFREKIMGYKLRSSAFDVAYDSVSDIFTFTTYGYGHGVGLSQNGANALAVHLGYDYKQILKYYYNGVEVY